MKIDELIKQNNRNNQRSKGRKSNKKRFTCSRVEPSISCEEGHFITTSLKEDIHPICKKNILFKAFPEALLPASFKEHMPNKADTTRLRSRTQNTCFLTSICTLILILVVQIASIFFLEVPLHSKFIAKSIS